MLPRVAVSGGFGGWQWAPRYSEADVGLLREREVSGWLVSRAGGWGWKSTDQLFNVGLGARAVVRARPEGTVLK